MTKIEQIEHFQTRVNRFCLLMPIGDFHHHHTLYIMYASRFKSPKNNMSPTTTRGHLSAGGGRASLPSLPARPAAGRPPPVQLPVRAELRRAQDDAASRAQRLLPRRVLGHRPVSRTGECACACAFMWVEPGRPAAVLRLGLLSCTDAPADPGFGFRGGDQGQISRGTTEAPGEGTTFTPEEGTN